MNRPPNKALQTDKVVPWGRSYDEYVSMFGLSEKDLERKIVGCGDGPAAFNSVLSKRGGCIVSVDPVYEYDSCQIRSRIDETYESVMAQMHANQADYVWEHVQSVENLGKIRMSAMDAFLADFDEGKAAGRYVAGELPSLPFENRRFDIALSSHFLFLYSAQLSADFHVQAIQEMLRVAREVRIFPLLSLNGVLSPHLEPVREHFSGSGCSVEIVRVAYQFQRGGNEMLVAKAV